VILGTAAATAAPGVRQSRGALSHRLARFSGGAEIYRRRQVTITSVSPRRPARAFARPEAAERLTGRPPRCMHTATALVQLRVSP